MLISGEAGVGKTRLVQEFFDYAHQSFNIHVLQGRGHELDLELSYHPWAEVLREGLDGLKREDLQALPPLWISEVAKLIPELRTRVPDLPANPPDLRGLSERGSGRGASAAPVRTRLGAQGLGACPLPVSVHTPRGCRASEEAAIGRQAPGHLLRSNL